jgi:hypothetical protein
MSGDLGGQKCSAKSWGPMRPIQCWGSDSFMKSRNCWYQCGGAPSCWRMKSSESAFPQHVEMPSNCFSLDKVRTINLWEMAPKKAFIFGASPSCSTVSLGFCVLLFPPPFQVVRVSFTGGSRLQIYSNFKSGPSFWNTVYLLNWVYFSFWRKSLWLFFRLCKTNPMICVIGVVPWCGGLRLLLSDVAFCFMPSMCNVGYYSPVFLRGHYMIRPNRQSSGLQFVIRDNYIRNAEQHYSEQRRP